MNGFVYDLRTRREVPVQYAEARAELYGVELSPARAALLHMLVVTKIVAQWNGLGNQTRFFSYLYMVFFYQNRYLSTVP